MKNIMLLILSCYCYHPIQSFSQIISPQDSTVITFKTDDSLIHFLPINYPYNDTPLSIITIDTTSTHLWQIGNTYKPDFTTDSVLSRGIMTDTALPYYANANDWFTLRFSFPLTNPQITIWHEFQTDSLHAGGIIEFSTDSGATWINIVNCYYVFTSNIYNVTDTLLSGQPCFTGNSNGQQVSQFEFTNCVGDKAQSTDCYFGNLPEDTVNISIRFRFVSDSNTSMSSGWKIDSIKIAAYACGPGFVQNVQNKTLNIYPIPAYNGIYNFPRLNNEIEYRTEIFDLLGNTIISMPYNMAVNISKYPKGLYFYKVTGNNEYYSGKLESD